LFRMAPGKKSTTESVIYTPMHKEYKKKIKINKNKKTDKQAS